MAKMYLTDDRDLLITDGENWYCFTPDCNGYMGDVDFYETKTITNEDGYAEERTLTLEELAEKIKEGIKDGKLYSADEFLCEYGERDDYLIKKWKGLSIEDIDRDVNYIEDVYSGDVRSRDGDITIFLEIAE